MDEVCCARVLPLLGAGQVPAVKIMYSLTETICAAMNHSSNRVLFGKSNKKFPGVDVVGDGVRG